MNVTEEEINRRWVDLSDRAVFRLTGPDSVRYLNGQVTNDVTKVDETNSLPACLCNAKGKVQALVWISKEGNSLLIDGELSQRDEVFARLDRYLIADDCELGDETGKLRLIHHFDGDIGGARSRRLTIPGYDRWITVDNGELSEDLRIPGEKWEELELRSRIPKASKEITGSEFPAELVVNEWAVDFQKGCYLGQEVISRIESVGRVKRQLSLIFADAFISQEATMRNEELGEGVATRDSKEISEGKNLSMGWFSNQMEDRQPTVFQKVRLD
jgi:folate-binding protein YgfZ